MLVSQVWKNVDKAKLIEHSNDEINKNLVRMGKGKFTFTEKFELAVVGVNTKDMADMANCAKQIVDQDFNGDAKAALGFMRDVHQSGIAGLDFNEMVHKGAAHRLIALQKADPDEFKRVLSGKFTNVAELNTALGAPSPQQQASLAPKRTQSAYTS